MVALDEDPFDKFRGRSRTNVLKVRRIYRGSACCHNGAIVALPKYSSAVDERQLGIWQRLRITSSAHVSIQPSASIPDSKTRARLICDADLGTTSPG